MPTVTTYNETFGSRDAEISLNDKGVPVARHTRSFKAVLSDGGSGADAAVAGRAAIETPLRSSHPYAPWARANSIRLRADSNDDRIWMVDVEYDTDTKSDEEQEQEEPDNPLDEQPDVEWDSDQFTKPLNKDIEGNSVTNSSDEPFDPLPEVDDSRNVLRVTRNEVANPIFLAQSYANAINSDTFLGAPAGYVKAKPVRASRQTKRLKDGTLQVYWKCSYEFHFKDPTGDETWDLELLDQGYRTIFDEGGDVGEIYLGITDSNDLPISKPVLLNGSGGALSHGAQPVFRSFKAYHRKSFAAFNLQNIS